MPANAAKAEEVEEEVALALCTWIRTRSRSRSRHRCGRRCGVDADADWCYSYILPGVASELELPSAGRKLEQSR